MCHNVDDQCLQARYNTLHWKSNRITLQMTQQQKKRVTLLVTASLPSSLQILNIPTLHLLYLTHADRKLQTLWFKQAANSLEGFTIIQLHLA